MTDESAVRTDWGALWRSGALPRFCFISLGVTFHAGAENMISTIMPAMVRDIGGIELNGWTFAIYEIGSIIAGAATGRLTTYWSVRTTMIVAALVFTLGTIETALSPTMYWALIGRLISGFGGGALISLSFVAVQRYFPSSIWPQLMAVLSVVWGVSAFGGPLYGGLIQTLLSWRWAFLLFAAAAVVFAIACVPLLRNEPERPGAGQGPRHFSHDFSLKHGNAVQTLIQTPMRREGLTSPMHGQAWFSRANAKTPQRFKELCHGI